MPANVVYHVAPADDGWTVAREGRRNLVAWCARREDAIERARREALKTPDALVRVHGEDYAVVEEISAEALAGAPRG